MADRLKGKRVLIYGGGTGIGLGCAEAMMREGAQLFLSGRRAAVLEKAVTRLSSLGRVGAHAGDATSVEDVQRVTGKAAAFLGGMDTIVVSAGAGGVTPILSTEPEEFQRIIDNNLRPFFLAVRYGAEHLLAAGKGSIIAVSSTFGLVGRSERVAYCGAKAGMNGMVKAMALDLANKDIRVNAICPGFVETELAWEVARLDPDPESIIRQKSRMHPIPRAGTVEEMGELAVYLASDLSAFVTGQAIGIDGGYSTA
jgi:NAD(P)-dependent dehydrogenase (short-subunit alcohol dehydrogenase family)